MTNDFNISQKEIEALLEKFKNGVIVLDLETTGLSPLTDKIIEIGAIKVCPNEIKSFSELINPEIEITDRSKSIHGISDEMVKNKPKIIEVLPNFLKFIENLPLIAHNAKFDLGFIVYNIHKNRLDFPNNQVYCSCQFSRKALSHMNKHNLGNLIDQLGISIGCQHRALDDSIAALSVFAQGLIQMKERNITKKDQEDHFKQSFQFNVLDFKSYNIFNIPDHLSALVDAIENQKTIEIIYGGGSIKNKFRPIKPLGILPMPSGTVLYAECLITNINKSFSLQKILEINTKKIK